MTKSKNIGASGRNRLHRFVCEHNTRGKQNCFPLEVFLIVGITELFEVVVDAESQTEQTSHDVTELRDVVVG